MDIETGKVFSKVNKSTFAIVFSIDFFVGLVYFRKAKAKIVL